MKPDGSSRSRSESAASCRDGDPALGARFERRDVLRVQVEPGGVVEVGGRLVVGEPEVGGADLDELPAGPQPGQRQRRVGAGADHQPHLRRQVLDEERHAGVDVRALGEVVVVEHEDHVVREHAQLVEHARPGRSRSAGRPRAAPAPPPRCPARPARARSARRSRTTSALASDSSSDTHAMRRSPAAACAASQAVSSVVLPNPAGAETRVNLVRPGPRARGVGGAPARGAPAGRKSLVSTSATGISSARPARASARRAGRRC